MKFDQFGTMPIKKVIEIGSSLGPISSQTLVFGLISKAGHGIFHVELALKTIRRQLVTSETLVPLLYHGIIWAYQSLLKCTGFTAGSVSDFFFNMRKVRGKIDPFPIFCLHVFSVFVFAISSAWHTFLTSS